MLAHGRWQRLSGVIVWGDEDRPAARVGWTIRRVDSSGFGMILVYELRDQIRDLVLLDIAPTAPGGRMRFWFRCPGCERRVAKLYRPIIWWYPRVRAYFRCRHCHGLAYDSELGRPAAAEIMERLGRRFALKSSPEQVEPGR